MEYTLENFAEDKTIANWWYTKNCSNIFGYYNEIMSLLLQALWKARLKYDSSLGAYTSYASKVCLNAYRHWYNKTFKKQKTKDFENVSLDANFDIDSEHTSVLDFYGYTPNFDSKFNCNYLKNCCEEIINNHKGNTFKKIIKEYLKSFNICEVGRKLNCSRQCVSQYIIEFRNLLHKKLLEDGYIV